jgi:hypothetical protein
MKKKTWLEGQSWNAIRRDLLRSPAMAVADPRVHKFLNILGGELALKEGRNNGNLKCPFSDIEASGLRRKCIKRVIAEAIALGLLSIKKGRAGGVRYGKSHRYRLTYMPILDDEGKLISEPTDEWAEFTTTKQAREAVSRTRKRSKVSRTGGDAATTKTVVAQAPLRSMELQPSVDPKKPLQDGKGKVPMPPLLSKSKIGNHVPPLAARATAEHQPEPRLHRLFALSTDPRVMQDST